MVLQKQQNDFASKTDVGSAELYFHYYGMLMHQQNMLQDQIRTGTYYAAILENPTDFQDKVVMDVGAGSGILSLFAAQVAIPYDHSCKLVSLKAHTRIMHRSNPATSPAGYVHISSKHPTLLLPATLLIKHVAC